MTVNDLENKVRSIDKATNAVASRQPSVAALAPPAAVPPASVVPSFAPAAPTASVVSSIVPTAAPPALPAPSSQPCQSTSSTTATSEQPRNMGGRAVGTTKKYATEKKKAIIEATNYVVVEYAAAKNEAKKLGKNTPRGTRAQLVEEAKGLFDVGDDFHVASSTIDNRIQAGNLQVFQRGPLSLKMKSK